MWQALWHSELNCGLGSLHLLLECLGSNACSASCPTSCCCVWEATDDGSDNWAGHVEGLDGDLCFWI